MQQPCYLGLARQESPEPACHSYRLVAEVRPDQIGPAPRHMSLSKSKVEQP